MTHCPKTCINSSIHDSKYSMRVNVRLQGSLGVLPLPIPPLNVIFPLKKIPIYCIILI